MKLSYFKNQAWIDIAREERYFCLELYNEMRKDLKPFLGLLEISKEKQFDIGFEVCFYRDLLKAHGRGIKETEFPQKRTFDLALFAEDEIIIIEAKAQQGFDNEQLKIFKNDIKKIDNLFKEIYKEPIKNKRLIGICSSKYTPKEDTKEQFHNNKIITWAQIADVYPDNKEIFRRADDIYRM